ADPGLHGADLAGDARLLVDEVRGRPVELGVDVRARLVRVRLRDLRLRGLPGRRRAGAGERDRDGHEDGGGERGDEALAHAAPFVPAPACDRGASRTRALGCGTGARGRRVVRTSSLEARAGYHGCREPGQASLSRFVLPADQGPPWVPGAPGWS